MDATTTTRQIDEAADLRGVLLDALGMGGREAEGVVRELDRLMREYAELKAAVWLTPGEPPEPTDDMTHAQTLRQARDQAWAFEALAERTGESDRLRNLVESLTARVAAQAEFEGTTALLRDVEAENARLSAEVLRLRGLLDRDRTGLAAALARVRRTVAGWAWLGCPGEWGCYDYAQQTVATLRDEVGRCLAEIETEAIDALRASGSLASDAFHGSKPADPVARDQVEVTDDDGEAD